MPGGVRERVGAQEWGGSSVECDSCQEGARMGAAAAAEEGRTLTKGARQLVVQEALEMMASLCL